MVDITDITQERLTALLQNVTSHRANQKLTSKEECIYCGVTIPLKRQEALPGVVSCVICASKKEK